MLKMTKTDLELVDDIDKNLFIENRMIGGIFYIAKIYGKANNKYMTDYDSNEKSKFKFRK